MAWTKKIGRHVVVNVVKTVGGNTAYVKRRPAIITAVGAGQLVTCRVGHFDTDNVTPGKQLETYTLIDRDLDLAPPRGGTYISTG